MMPEVIELTANAMGDSGKVMILPRGEYNSATSYEELDCVYYQGRSYICKLASTGHAPTDTTYWQPMTPDSSAEIQALTNYVTETGVKNLLPITAENATSDTLQFTVNKNSNGSVTSITWSGKREGSGRYFKQLADAFILPAGSYILSGGYNSYASVLITGISAEDTGSGATFVSDGVTAITPYAVVYNGRDYNGETIYPMIRDASITDPTYQPYAKTNVELTQDVAGLAAKSFTKITDSEYANEVLFAKSGTSKIVQVSAPKGIAANTNVEIPIPSGYTSEVAIATGSLASFTSDFVISGGKIRMSINNAGKIELRSSIAITSAIDEVLYMSYV